MLHDPKRQAQIEEELFHSQLRPWQLLLLGAADYLRMHGWVRGSLMSHTGEACTLGAMLTTFKTPLEIQNYDGCAIIELENRPEGRKAINAITQHFDNVVSIINWNDCKAKSAKEVIRTLQYVALGG